MNKPKDIWGLTFIERVNVDDIEWVVYSDGDYSWAIQADDWDNPTDETDYSLWCSSTRAVGDEQLCSKIAKAAGLKGIYMAGISTWAVAK